MQVILHQRSPLTKHCLLSADQLLINMASNFTDAEKLQETRFDIAPKPMSTEQHIDGHTLYLASTHDTEKQSSSTYAASVSGEDHKKGLALAERKLLLKLGESQRASVQQCHISIVSGIL
jgi:hypothetical protein